MHIMEEHFVFYRVKVEHGYYRQAVLSFYHAKYYKACAGVYTARIFACKNKYRVFEYFGQTLDFLYGDFGVLTEYSVDFIRKHIYITLDSTEPLKNISSAAKNKCFTFWPAVSVPFVNIIRKLSGFVA